jgi:hypothetical protein
MREIHRPDLMSRGGTAKAWGLSLQLPLRLDPQIQLQLSI